MHMLLVGQFEIIIVFQDKTKYNVINERPETKILPNVYQLYMVLYQ